MKWIGPDIWLKDEAARIRQRNILKWVDRIGWILICVGAGYLAYHLLFWILR
jgi:hypothetical protein